MPHLLYVAWGYPPSRGAGMYRALATANAFASNGWRVTVLTATKETFERLTGTDPQSETAVDPRITVVRIPFDPERGEANLAKWPRSRVFSPLLWNYLRGFRARAGFPELGYASWRRPLVEAAAAIHAREPVSLVVGSANPNVDFMPGDYLYRKHKVPYVMDYRDAWNLDVYSGKRVGTRLGRAARIEKRLIGRAVEAWFVNGPIREWHANAYPPRAADLHVVSNGFDPSFLDTTRTRTPNPSSLVFGFLGTIYGPIPLRETLEAWRLARQTSALLANATLLFRGRLGHFAEPDPVAAALLEEFAADGVRYEGPVSKTEVSGFYASVDALLLVISRSRYVTSGKVFEYAATGLPIASLHHPETAATSVLTGHPFWFPTPDLSVRAIADTLIRIAEQAARMTPADFEAAQQWAMPLARDRQLLPRIEALRALVSRGGA